MTATEFARRSLLGAMLLAAAMAAGCQTSAMLSLPGSGASSSAEDILAGIRRSKGLAVLSPDAKLERAAREQAGLMARAGRMGHTTGRGQDFLTRIRRNGVEGAAAENVARGRFDLPRLFLAWMNSAGHRRNMLDPRFTRYGLASAPGSKAGERYWALVLGSRG